ncbi:MAG TPA: Uma2 family endonuclease [Phototrophicaceae bacterium]|nr:Uma2 family endonuclease [Phototrophicaceae bacterium]
MASVQVSPLTVDDLLRLDGQDKRFEVVNGEIIEMPPASILHVLVMSTVFETLKAFVVAHRLGFVFPDNLLYVLHVDPESGVRETRSPDISFVRKGRITKATDLTRPFFGAPDLAVEVVSPGESADDLLGKIRDYLAYGSEQVWVLYPAQRELHQYIHGEKNTHLYTEDDVLTADTLFPGLSLRIGNLFILPELEE